MVNLGKLMGLFAGLCLLSGCVSDPVMQSCDNQGIHWQGSNAVLNVGMPSSSPEVYVFQNVSDKSYWLNHASNPPAASAGWGSQIDPGHYSAMLQIRDNFSINCNSIAPGKATPLNCKQVLKVCHLHNVKLPLDAMGGFWIAENEKDSQNLIAAMRQRGFRMEN